MKTRKLTSALIAMLCITLVLSSCSKDEEETVAPAPTKKQMLSGNNWVIKAYTVEPAIDIDQNGTQENNLLPYLQACNLDDFIDLNEDNSYTAEEGASKCDPNDPQVYETGDWSFNSDETFIVFSPDGQASYEFSIESLSASQWEAKQVQVSNGVTYTFSLTFD
jgi:hypothetical protein